MNDRNMGMLVATGLVAPIMVICCGGGLILAGSLLSGLTGLVLGWGVFISLVIAIVAGAAMVLARHRSRRPGGSEPDLRPGR